MTTPLVSLFLAGCVLENDIGGKDDDPVGFDSDPTLPVDTNAETDTAPVEDCNGLDDDGDGQIDEGFPDGDADGFADCLEGECPPTGIPVGGAVAVNDDCAGVPYTPDTPTADPWHARALWTFEGTPTEDSSVTPIIGNLDDDNGDGVVDRQDIPDVLISGGTDGIYVLDGATGALKWTFPELLGLSRVSPLIADLDGDGLPEVVSLGLGFELVAYNTDLTVKWRTSIGAYPGSTYLSAADLDGDGIAEVLLGDWVFDGNTGAVRFGLPTSSDFQPTTAVGDLDLDGDQEIFHRGTLYDSDGTPLWATPVPPGMEDSYPMIVNADADDEGELVLVSDHVAVYDTDGTLLAESALFTETGFTGAPTAADFDGDGQMELAVAVYYNGPLAAYELDGTVKWEVDSP